MWAMCGAVGAAGVGVGAASGAPRPTANGFVRGALRPVAKDPTIGVESGAPKGGTSGACNDNNYIYLQL